MSDTLESLHRAVIATPGDRTVRLVYADALEESGEPVHLARATFIRAQIERESLPPDDPRRDELQTRISELFEAHWLSWWTPVAQAARLPTPHVPGKRVRDRIARTIRRRQRRPKNWPYFHTTSEPTVHLPDYGLTFAYRGGFPDEVRCDFFPDPEEVPPIVHQWGDALPLARLRFGSFPAVANFAEVDGPHLARLAELAFDNATAEFAAAAAASPHLASVTSLTANPVGSDPDTIHSLVAHPAWRRLGRLSLNGRLSADGVRELASACSLEHLEELDLFLGNPGLLGSPVGEIVSGIFRMFMRAVEVPYTQAPRWIEYGPAFEALAAAKWVRGLRCLRIASGHPSGLAGMLGERLYGGTESVTDVIPDAAVLRLVEALSPDKLERLLLPAAIIGPSVREDLTTRLGPKVAFV